MSAPAHSSQESDLEHPTKVGNEIKEALYLYSLPKRPKLRRLLEKPDNKGFLQKTHWRSSTSRRTVWLLDNGGSQSPQRGMVNRGTITGTLSLQDLATPWIQSYPSSLGTGKSLLRFLEPSHRPKVTYTETTRWNLENLVKIYHGITALQHVIYPRHMASLYCHSQDWMKRWWFDSMECYCYLRNVQDFQTDGKTPYE